MRDQTLRGNRDWPFWCALWSLPRSPPYPVLAGSWRAGMGHWGPWCWPRRWRFGRLYVQRLSDMEPPCAMLTDRWRRRYAGGGAVFLGLAQAVGRCLPCSSPDDRLSRVRQRSTYLVDMARKTSAPYAAVSNGDRVALLLAGVLGGGAALIGAGNADAFYRYGAGRRRAGPLAAGG